MSLLRLSGSFMPVCQTCHRASSFKGLSTTTKRKFPHNPPAPPPLPHTTRLSHLKYPPRGGQALSLRYQYLEQPLRDAALLPAPSIPDKTIQSPSVSVQDAKRTFRGFVIPDRPKPPADDECCMSGCAVCVYDLYDEDLTEYTTQVTNIRTGLVQMGVPECEWPAEIRTELQDQQGGAPKSNNSVALSAFEQLELALKAKTGQAAAPVPPPPVLKRPPKRGVGMDDVVEGLRWVLFSNR